MAVRPIVPTDIPGCTLALDTLDASKYVVGTNGTDINSWTDKAKGLVFGTGSGRPQKITVNGNIAFQGAVNFNYFTLTAANTFPNETSDETRLFVGFSAGSYTPSIRSISTNNVTARAVGTVDPAGRAGLPKSGNDLATTVPYDSNGSIVIGEWIAGTSGTATIYVNGTQAATRTIANATTTVNRMEILSNTNSTTVIDWVFGVYDWPRKLTLKERQDAEGAVAWSFNRVDLLPANHPWKTSRPMFDDGTGGATVTPAAASQTQTATSPALSPKASVAVDSASQGQTATSATIAARVSVAVDSASQSNAATSPTMAARSVVSVDGASQANTATSPGLATRASTQPDAATQSQTATSPVLAARATAQADSSTQGQQASSPTLSNVRSAVVVDSAVQGQAATQPSIQTGAAIAAASASQTQTATQPTLTSRVSASVSSAAQGQASTSPTIATAGSLAVNSATQSNAATSPTLSIRYQVAVESSAQGQSATSAVVTMRYQVTAASALQAQAATAPAATARSVVSVNSSVQAQFATSPILFVGKRPPPPPTRTVSSLRQSRIVVSVRFPRLAA